MNRRRHEHSSTSFPLYPSVENRSCGASPCLTADLIGASSACPALITALEAQ
jgi:hypothetical protein